MKNPRILHRVYFDDMPPFEDPFKRYLDTWTREMPGYKIMQWNGSNVDLEANEWVRRAKDAKAPVFLSEYYRWKALQQYGGMYLDADCEILDGSRLHQLIEDVFASDEYDAAVGVEDYYNGHPTAQTVIAKPNSELANFMVEMYEKALSGPLWHWREMRGLIGPQLMSLYFIEKGHTKTHGMMTQLDEPTVAGRVKVYPQEYFSPKFTLDGDTLRHTENTCVYHLFANLNVEMSGEERERHRKDPMLYHEYVEMLKVRSGMGVPSAPEVVGNVAPGERLPAVSGKGQKRKARPNLKVLHRVYFGFDGKPDRFQGYLQTWADQLPDFEIKLWNASNLPMDLNDYVKELYEARDHAFLTDYFRWWLLREYGGMYLDADVEVTDGAQLRELIEELEVADKFDAFIGIDEKTGGWYTAHSMASKPGAKIASYMCSVYEGMGPIKAWRKKAFYLWAPQLTALYFFENGHHVGGMGTSPHMDNPAIYAGVKVYPQDYFSPLAPKADGDQLFSLNAYTQRTSLCHHFACSWHDEDSAYLNHADGVAGNGNRALADIARELGVTKRLNMAAEMI